MALMEIMNRGKIVKGTGKVIVKKGSYKEKPMTTKKKK